MTQRHARADRHALAQLEVRDILLGTGHNGFLTGDLRQLLDRRLDNLLIAYGLTESLIDDDLLQYGDLHHAAVTELLDKGGHHLLLVHFLECGNVSHYFNSSPDFLE